MSNFINMNFGVLINFKTNIFFLFLSHLFHTCVDYIAAIVTHNNQCYMMLKASELNECGNNVKSFALSFIHGLPFRQLPFSFLCHL